LTDQSHQGARGKEKRDVPGVRKKRASRGKKETWREEGKRRPGKKQAIAAGSRAGQAKKWGKV